MPRQARLDAPGTLHHIIIRGIEQRKIVDDRKDRENFLERVGRAALETGTSIYAWSLMPNHAHFLLRSGQTGISTFMRRFLTGYAITYNQRHRRHGHLFQNRYKSIVCDENSYFAELVRYIHLNPLRATLVKALSELDRYRYCGHSVLMGRVKNEWQDRDYVLNRFGNKEGEARKAYRVFLKGGIAEGNRPELVGGGLIRSLGGWSEVKSLRRQGEGRLTDERILGNGDFVMKILQEADDKLKKEFSAEERREKMKEVVEEICKKEGVNIQELESGSRRSRVSEARLQIVCRLIETYGIPLAEIARQVGVSTSAVCKIITRKSS
jgi:REP element-mobilizing transposase RayT